VVEVVLVDLGLARVYLLLLEQTIRLQSEVVGLVHLGLTEQWDQILYLEHRPMT